MSGVMERQLTEQRFANAPDKEPQARSSSATPRHASSRPRGVMSGLDPP